MQIYLMRKIIFYYLFVSSFIIRAQEENIYIPVNFVIVGDNDEDQDGGAGVRCRGLRKDGERCLSRKFRDTDYCWHHRGQGP